MSIKRGFALYLQYLCLALVFVCPHLFAQSMDLSDGLKKVYIYQKQDMREVNWLYLGFAPRMEDPRRVDVTISKGGYTLRVTMKMTEAEVADYPSYLVRRADDILKIASENQILIQQEFRFEKYLETIEEVRQALPLATTPAAKFQQGLALLKKNFPQNIFDLNKSDTDGTVVIGVFVYPITINKAGPNWPKDNLYVQAEHYHSPYSAIEERRTDHGHRAGVDDNGDGTIDRHVRVVKDHIFSGFPAFWLDASGKGTGVHGPIRFSRFDETRNGSQSGPYGRQPEQMLKFWSENEFLFHDYDIKTGLDKIALRWDVVRTNNSQGCFRAETMELRHLLPADKNSIYKGVKWNVISAVDEISFAHLTTTKKVDVNYYMVNPYSFPQTREQWIAERILTAAERKSNDKHRLVQEFIEKSVQFPYLDPSIVEFSIGDGFDEYKSRQVMTKFNQAGGVVGAAQTYL